MCLCSLCDVIWFCSAAEVSQSATSWAAGENLWHYFEQLHLWTFTKFSRLKLDIKLLSSERRQAVVIQHGSSRSVLTSPLTLVRWCNHTWCVSAWCSSESSSTGSCFNIWHLHVLNVSVKFVKVSCDRDQICVFNWTQIRLSYGSPFLQHQKTNHALENLNYDTLNLWDKKS